MRALAVAAVMAATQVGEPVGCSGSEDSAIEVRWELAAGAEAVPGFEVALHGCADWTVETASDHLRLDAGWTRCAVSGLVRDGALVVETEAFVVDGDEDVVLPFHQLPVGPIGGMGAEVVAQRHGVLVRRVHEGTPAEMAGLRAGDRVVGVDGWPTLEVTTREFVRMATGRPGTVLEVDVLRDGEPLTFRLTRERLPLVD